MSDQRKPWTAYMEDLWLLIGVSLLVLTLCHSCASCEKHTQEMREREWEFQQKVKGR